MGRRSSGWTVVKQIAREIDRANRRAQRERVVSQKALIRLQERTQREREKFVESVTREVIRSQERFNKAMYMANASENLSFKEIKLQEACQNLEHLKKLGKQHSFIDLQNLPDVEAGIEKAQKEIDILRAQEKERQSLESQAAQNTEKANRIREEIERILLHTLDVDDAIDWEGLKDSEPFLIPRPRKPPKPMLPPKPELVEIPERPELTDKLYSPRIPVLYYFLKSKKTDFLNQVRARYEADLQAWEKKSALIQVENQKNLEEWERKKEKTLFAWEEEYSETCADWERRKEAHVASQSQYNGGIDKLKKEYESRERSAIEEYCRLVLARSEYPFSFSKDYQIQYFQDTELLAVDYQLPTIEVVPSLKEEKFIKSRDEVKATFISDKKRDEIYEGLLYEMVIRTIHEIFESDTADVVNSIALNGWITALNKATGHDETRCIITVSVSKEEFLRINLSNVDAKECFKSLKGIGGARLSNLVPVAPVVTLSKEDKRFVESYAVIEHVDEGENLALMDWEDFEHLIREIFEKEYCANNSEVKVTQASRDGGVDAIIYDPDPIRGGKIVVQAKRYTNTVGVSAVRDLYGTVQHEGAMKGILITTSNYGSDAYDFAKGKPLTLMNGGNLIHLLEKHGKKARINLGEARAACI